MIPLAIFVLYLLPGVSQEYDFDTPDGDFLVDASGHLTFDDKGFGPECTLEMLITDPFGQIWIGEQTQPIISMMSPTMGRIEIAGFIFVFGEFCYELELIRSLDAPIPKWELNLSIGFVDDDGDCVGLEIEIPQFEISLSS